ncbi:TetR/AcrR family transcriptional regulator [Streptomyces zaehneri]|uniref:TetR/AcrR family transcriptional regulator n=1 Tax=Streptomyces zaehneri TaxID=3051180 RepID=UPI0028D32DD0|nr:TetR/AcrR family transcriptional regulator [Streptomyces sp. DSM 40713]
MPQRTTLPGRTAARTAAIIGATHELLREVGYEQLSIDAVATRAGASKTTIYRRWADKRALVCAALLDRSVSAPELPSGAHDLREDLVALTDLAAALADQEDVPGFVSLLAAAQKEPAVGEALQNGALDPMRRNCRDVVQRAIGRGELQDAALSDVLFDLVLGQVLARSVVQGKAFSPDVRERFVDTVLLHVLTSQHA